MNRYTEEEYQFVIDYYPTHSRTETAAAMSERFGKQYTDRTVKYIANIHGVKTVNSGKFKKGNMPHNTKKIGSEMDAADCIRVKTGEGKWERKSRVVWREAYGEIPEGYVIMHLDGNCLNSNLDNLIMVKSSIALKLNASKMLYKDRELTEAAIAYWELRSKLRERVKKK